MHFAVNVYFASVADVKRKPLVAAGFGALELNFEIPSPSHPVCAHIF